MDLDEGFWHSAYDAHGGAVFGFLLKRTGRREVAEDLLQETFTRAIRAGSFRPGLGDLRAYLMTGARHLLVNRARRPKLVVAAEPRRDGGDAMARVAATAESPEQEAAWSDFLEGLEAVLQEMPEAHRTAFRMGVLEQRPYRDVARLNGWSASQVKINVYRARKRVIRELGGQIPEIGGHR